LSRLSSVSSASPSATPPLNVLSFAVAATIPLLRKFVPGYWCEPACYS
jgi:hypothetical protein